MTAPVGVPLPTIRRLPAYLRILAERREAGDAFISSEALGKRLGLGAIQVRKDLGSVGAAGKAKHGFPVAETARVLTRFLGADDYADLFLIGAGPLGTAVLADENLERHGFRIVAVFDADAALVGGDAFGFEVLSVSRLPDLARRMDVKLAVLAISDSGLKTAVEVVARSPLSGLFDLTGLAPELPQSILVVRQDFGSRLAALAGELRGKRKG